MSYTIRYNRSSNHIQGLTEATQSSGEERGGVVGYYAQSACAGLTRSGRSMGTGQSYDTVQDALTAARSNAAAAGRKVCKSCEKAAVRIIDNI
jgi:hypothetical protein